MKTEKTLPELFDAFAKRYILLTERQYEIHNTAQLLTPKDQDIAQNLIAELQAMDVEISEAEQLSINFETYLNKLTTERERKEKGTSLTLVK